MHAARYPMMLSRVSATKSTMLSISGANACTAAKKQVDVTSKIWCNIVTGTYLIWAGWLVDLDTSLCYVDLRASRDVTA